MYRLVSFKADGTLTPDARSAQPCATWLEAAQALALCAAIPPSSAQEVCASLQIQDATGKAMAELDYGHTKRLYLQLDEEVGPPADNLEVVLKFLSMTRKLALLETLLTLATGDTGKIGVVALLDEDKQVIVRYPQKA